MLVRLFDCAKLLNRPSFDETNTTHFGYERMLRIHQNELYTETKGTQLPLPSITKSKILFPIDIFASFLGHQKCLPFGPFFLSILEAYYIIYENHIEQTRLCCTQSY